MFPQCIKRISSHRLIACLTIALGALPAAAVAEENLWSFEVRELIEYSRGKHVIVLVPVPAGLFFPRTCKELVIHASLEVGKGVPTRFAKEFTLEAYERAIRKLRRAQVSRALVRLVSLDGGFGRPKDFEDECAVASSGLAVLSDPNRQPAIFSVY